ncbi:MAG: glycosyltransferase family 4 protein [Calditrichaeota bacterium]|nr:glycosyltransferase family 4 protein [Calditrichota bacterium]
MPNLHVTGGARVAVEFSNRMVERGHEFYILIPSGRYSLPVKTSAKVIECGIEVSSPLLAVITGIIPMLGHVPDVDVIISCMPPYALLCRYLGYKRAVPCVDYLLNDDVHFFDDGSYIHSRLLLNIYRLMARLSIRRGINFVNSHWTAVQTVAEGGVRPTAIIPQGYNPEVFYPAQTIHHNNNKVTILTIGRKAHWKGFADLIEALNIVDQNRYPFDLKVISQDKIDYSLAKFPLSLHKPVNDNELSDLYRTGQVYVHSSWFEGFGKPPLEAQACGLAVISTDCGGVREYLIDNDNALLVPPREPVTLARTIERVIGDRKLLNRLAERGLKTCGDFCIEKTTDQFEAALQELIEKYNKCHTPNYQ